MKKVKLYIVTYNNPVELNKTLTSLFSSTGVKNPKIEVNIINNHTNFSLNPEFEDKVTKVYHNDLRPDFSTGHLSRNWNQGIINGFKDLKKPDCDLIVLCQDDTIFKKFWLRKCIEVSATYDFVTQGWGDNFMLFTPNAIKRIGLFDERFPFGGVGAEYFIRAVIVHRDKVSINDHFHGRVYNPLESKCYIAGRPKIPKNHRDERKTNRLVCYATFRFKFPGLPFKDWDTKFRNNPPKKYGGFNFSMYPYFEQDVETLEEQNYIGFCEGFKDLNKRYYYETKKKKNI